ncbi:MAG: ABC transporter substrate-binding protein [Candidatus Hodarchaeales archaeon]
MKRVLKVSVTGILALLLVLPANPIFASMTSIDSVSSPAQDHLVIIHPHSADFAGYVISGFRNWYNWTTGSEITVDTIERDSGGCYDEVYSWGGVAVEADVYWGGGRYYFEEARTSDKGNLLLPYEVAEDENITNYLGGWNLKDLTTATPSWYGAAISGFGIMYNKEVLDGLGLDYPETWDDLTKHDYSGQIIMATPDKSGSTCATVKQILMEKNDQTDAANITDSADITEGWEYWAKVTGNVGEFVTDSADVPAKVYDSHYGIGVTIDYYAWDKIALWDQIVFTYGGASTFSPDPVAIVEGTTRVPEAQKFMDYIMSTEGQQRVGRYRIPANFEAVPESQRIPRAWDETGEINPDFPVIVPFNVTLDDDLFYPTKKMFHYWFVQNREEAVTSWEAIGDATDATARDNAIDMHTKLPSNFNGTLGNLTSLSLDYALWEQEGLWNFNNATLEAPKDYDDPIVPPDTSEEPGDTEETTEATSEEGTEQAPGFEVLVLLASIATLVTLHRKKKRK